MIKNEHLIERYYGSDIYLDMLAIVKNIHQIEEPIRELLGPHKNGAFTSIGRLKRILFSLENMATLLSMFSGSLRSDACIRVQSIIEGLIMNTLIKDPFATCVIISKSDHELIHAIMTTSGYEEGEVFALSINEELRKEHNMKRILGGDNIPDIIFKKYKYS